MDQYRLGHNKTTSLSLQRIRSIPTEYLCRKLEEETERYRIDARESVEIQKLHNQRQCQEKRHASAMQNAQHDHDQEMAKTANNHTQKMQHLANQRKAEEDAQQMRLKNHEKEMKKAEYDQTLRMKELDVKQFDIKCNHDREMNIIKGKGENSKMLSELMMVMINKNMSAAEFANKAEAVSKVVRGEAIGNDTLKMIGEQNQRLEEAKLQHAIGHRGGGRSARQVLRDVEELVTENEDDYDESIQQQRHFTE